LKIPDLNYSEEMSSFLFATLPIEVENMINKNVKYIRNYNNVISQIKRAGEKAEDYIIYNQAQGLFEGELIGESLEWEYSYWNYLGISEGF
jgi:hypothetical protein